MVQKIKRLPPELQVVVALPAQTKLLMGGEVHEESRRPDNAVARRVAEVIERLQGKGCRVEPRRGGAIVERLADAGGVWTIDVDVGVGAVHPGARIDGKAAPPGDDRADLPSAGHSVTDRVVDVPGSTVSHRDVIKTGDHQPLAIVERGVTVLAAHAVPVLGEQ